MSLFSRTLSEEEVKRKLKIDDFRHLSKDKVIKFASYLDRMDPEVAKAALAQVPEFALTVRAAIENSQKVVSKGLESNDFSVKWFYSMAEESINSLRKRIEEPSISEDERKAISSEIIEILKMVSEKDSENKKHIRQETTKMICACVGTTVLVGASVGLTVVLRQPVDINK